MLTKEEIKEKIIPVLEQFDIARASLFGSFARGDQSENSDVDIIIEFRSPENRSLLDLVAVEQEISELLQRKADVLTVESIHPLLRSAISAEQEILYER